MRLFRPPNCSRHQHVPVVLQQALDQAATVFPKTVIDLTLLPSPVPTLHPTSYSKLRRRGCRKHYDHRGADRALLGQSPAWTRAANLRAGDVRGDVLLAIGCRWIPEFRNFPLASERGAPVPIASSSHHGDSGSCGLAGLVDSDRGGLGVGERDAEAAGCGVRLRGFVQCQTYF